MNNKYITLGKLAKLSHINRDTLSFYVRKELIKPVHIGDNGYKYFLPDQIQSVNFIRFYRHLNFSLDTIKVILREKNDKNSLKDTLKIFEKQQQYLQEKILTLQSATKLLENEYTFMQYIEQYEPNTPFIDFLEEAIYHITPVRFCYSLKEDIYAQNFSDFFTADENFLAPQYPLCCIIPNTILLTENFCPCQNKFNKDTQPQPEMKQTINDIPPIINKSMETFNIESTPFVRPSGKYAVMVNQGGTDSIYPAVKKLSAFLKNNQLHLKEMHI